MKKAIYAAIAADAVLMAKLGGKGPYPGRLPKDAALSRSTAVITYAGQTALRPGWKEDQTYTLSLWSYSADLLEDVAADLDRLFHPSGINRYWRPLSVVGGIAFTRREFAADLPDPASELAHMAYRLRVLFAKAA